MAGIKLEGLPPGTEYRRLVDGWAKYGLDVTHELNFDPSQMHVATFNISEGSWSRLEQVGREEISAKILAGVYEAGVRIAPNGKDSTSGSDSQDQSIEVKARLIIEIIDIPGHADFSMPFLETYVILDHESLQALARPQPEDPPRGSVAWANKELGLTGS